MKCSPARSRLAWDAPTRFALIPRAAFLAGVLGAAAHAVEHLEGSLLQEQVVLRG